MSQTNRQLLRHLGAIIYRAFQVSRLLVLLALVLALVSTVSAQKQPKRSPHGSLNIPCENCHTNSGWTPIRAIPEFNHDTTRYPLRGMHQKVSCTGCHTKPVFTDVGKDCARLPRRYSPRPIWRQLRRVPHASRLAGFHSIDSEPLQPVSAARRARRCAVRGVPQECRGWKLPGPFNGMRVLPYIGFQ